MDINLVIGMLALVITFFVAVALLGLAFKLVVFAFENPFTIILILMAFFFFVAYAK